MKLFKEICGMCKCSVSITVNAHRDIYESVEVYLDEKAGEILPDVLSKMIETDTLIEVQAYPDTPIGFYIVRHYDIDMALQEMRDILTEI